MDGMSTKVRLRSERFIRRAITDGVLKTVGSGKKREMHRPCMILACGDMDQATDRLTHFWKTVSPRSQLVMMHGGMLLLDSLCPANRCFNSVPAVVHQIRTGIEAKRRKGVVIEALYGYVDWHCGVAVGSSMSAEDEFWAAINAKQYIKTHAFPELEVGLLCSIYDLGFISDLPIVQEHPTVDGLTFYFDEDEMEVFLTGYREDEEFAANPEPSVV